MPTPPTPPTYWWLTVRIDACRTRDERVAAASGDDAVRMWRELHPKMEVIHVRPVPELVDIELEYVSTNNNTDPIRGVPPLLAARDALAEPERVAPKSIEERIAEADAAVEASMKRIRKIIATPARQLAAEAKRSAVPVADGPAVPEGREPASVVSEPSDREGPTTEEVEELCEEHCFNVEGYESIECLQGLINEAIARWGRPAPAPAGKAAEVMGLFRRWADAYPDGVMVDPYWLTRAADLLERQAAPVPVAERPTDTQLIEEAIAVGLAFQPQDEVSEVFLPFDAEEPLDELLVNFARAVLARWGSCQGILDSSAAPEPAGGEPSDDSAEEWQWYTYCPEEGIELYSNRQQAQSAAQSIMGSYEVAAHSDGWHEDMELVSWGMLVAVEQAQVVECCPADPGGEFDEWVRYELRAAARHGRPAPTPAGDVGELVAELRRICFDVAPCDSDTITRAADLLEQLSSGWVVPTVEQLTPVPVSERLPGLEDCDAYECCWFWTPCISCWEFRSRNRRQVHDTHWLPANALLLPAGEVK